MRSRALVRLPVPLVLPSREFLVSAVPCILVTEEILLGRAIVRREVLWEFLVLEGWAFSALGSGRENEPPCVAVYFVLIDIFPNEEFVGFFLRP